MRFLSIYKSVKRQTPPTQEEMAAIGKLIEEGAKAGDKAALDEHVAAYGEYLANLHITYE